MKSRISAKLVALLSMMPFAVALAADAKLGGSMASMRRQHAVAKKNSYTFLRTAAQVREFVREDRLDPLVSNEHLHVNNVSFPYARPEVTLFVQRLAQQYHEATGKVLVVTSLTRPLTKQPRNAHELSVHPAGMAVDFRVPSGSARVWLENTLLALEAQGVIDATRERRPPHYHVAVFPDLYTAYAEKLIEREASDAAGITVAEATANDSSVGSASLDPSASDSTSHDEEMPPEPAVGESNAVEAAVPLAASLGVGVVAIAGLIRRRLRRQGEDRRFRHREP